MSLCAEAMPAAHCYMAQSDNNNTTSVCIAAADSNTYTCSEGMVREGGGRKEEAKRSLSETQHVKFSTFTWSRDRVPTRDARLKRVPTITQHQIW